MRIFIVLLCVAMIAICAEGQQRGIKRFSPPRSRLNVDPEPEVNTEQLNDEQTKEEPSNPNRRNLLRPRAFSSRFSSRNTAAATTGVKKPTEPQPTPKPVAAKGGRNTRRRPQFYRKRTTTTTTTTTTEIPIVEEETEVVVVEEKVSPTNEKIMPEEISTKAPSKVPKLSTRLIPLRTSFRNRRPTSETKSPKIKMAADVKKEPIIEKKTSPQTPTRHRFSGDGAATRFRGRRPRLPKISEHSVVVIEDVQETETIPKAEPVIQEQEIEKPAQIFVETKRSAKFGRRFS